MKEKIIRTAVQIGFSLTVMASLIVSVAELKNQRLWRDAAPEKENVSYVSSSDHQEESQDARKEPSVVMYDQSGKITLAGLQTKFPHGKYWNHVGGSNNPDGYTDKPCPDHKNCSFFPDECSCNSFLDAIQCRGFVMKLAYEYYGSSIRDWKKVKTLQSLKPGDAVCYKNGSHTIWITEVKGSTVTFADCNGSGRCRIRWNQTMKKSGIDNIKYVYVAPYPLEEAAYTGYDQYSHVPDPDYAREFQAVVKYRMTILDDRHRPAGNDYVEKEETCVVHEVYTDGCCRVTYSGEKGEETNYCYLTDFDRKTVKIADDD